MKEIIKNAVVIYNDDLKQNFDAISIKNNGLVIYRIIKGDYIDCGFISKINVKKITTI